MRDSGVEWIGEIPAGWHFDKINRICSIVTDYVASGSFADLAENVTYLDSPDYAMLIRTADISGKGSRPKPVFIDKHSYEFLANSNLFGGELLLPNIGASVGDIYIVPVLYERMSLAPNSIIFKTKYLDRFYYYFFCSIFGREMLLGISGAAAQPKFNKTDFKQLRVVVPPLPEQQVIADYLDAKTAEIDSLIADKQRQVELLREYRKSLISEAVTGKFKVPGLE